MCKQRTICNNYRMIAIGVDQSDPILDSLGFAFFLLSFMPRCMNTCNYRAVNLGGFQRHQSQTTRAPLQNYTLQRFSIEPQSVISTLSATQRNQTLRQCKDKPASKFMLSWFFWSPILPLSPYSVLRLANTSSGKAWQNKLLPRCNDHWTKFIEGPWASQPVWHAGTLADGPRRPYQGGEIGTAHNSPDYTVAGPF